MAHRGDTTMLSESERSDILDAEIMRWTVQGYRVTSRTATTAQLVRPKTFDVALAILGLLLLVVGLLIYLLVYAAKADESVYLSIDPDGSMLRQLGGGGSGQHDPRRWTCAHCGYRNTPGRPRCKRCRVEREDAA